MKVQKNIWLIYSIEKILFHKGNSSSFVVGLHIYIDIMVCLISAVGKHLKIGCFFLLYFSFYEYLLTVYLLIHLTKTYMHGKEHVIKYHLAGVLIRISSLNVKPMKLVDQFTHLGSNISTTEHNVNISIGKAWTAIGRLITTWKSDLSD